MTQHTPTPFIAANASNGRIFNEWGIFADGKRIATVHTGQGDAERLAAAVNSHAALVEACRKAGAIAERVDPKTPAELEALSRDLEALAWETSAALALAGKGGAA